MVTVFFYVQYGRTALMCAASEGRTEVVKYLIENTTVQVNIASTVSHLDVCVF